MTKVLAALLLVLAAPLTLAATPAKSKPAMAGHDHSQPLPRDGATAAVQPPLAANAEKISHGRFTDLVVYKPQGTPTAFVLFLSGDGGWVQKTDGGVIEMAQKLVAQGAMVVGISTPDAIADFEKDDGDCVYPDGDLENLSHFVQAYYKIPTYLSPILVGYSSGASLAYGVLAQAPTDTFAGLMTLGFDPELAMKKPLCAGTGVAFTKTRTGVRFKPSKNVGDPWMALQGSIDQATPLMRIKPFVDAVPGARLVEVPKVGHGFSDPHNWLQPFLDGFNLLAKQNKAKELPPPPASLSGLPVIEVPAAAGTPASDQFAVLVSGDGGWAGIDTSVATALAAKGVAVVGVDSLRYFWGKRTPDVFGADMDKIVRYYLKAWNKKKVMLIGYSQGADVMPFALTRLPAATMDSVSLAALLGISARAAFEFHMSNWVSSVDDGLPTQPELDKLPPALPVLCLYGHDDDDAICGKLDPKRYKIVDLPGGHHFSGDYDRVAQEILDGAKR